MITIKDLKKKFGDQVVLDGVTAQIDSGEIVAILGSSGSGKSTLLRCINDLERPCLGKILIHGVLSNDTNIQSIREQVGMVFQNFHLFSHMTVLQNLIYAPIQVKKILRDVANEKAKKLLAQVGLENKLNVYPHTLSGGEKQRVAIARTLMMDPEIVLFDEPTSALDPEMVQEVLKVMKNLATTGITMLIVTHEMGFVREVASRVLFLDRGKIIEDQTTEQFFGNQVNSRIKLFINRA